MLEELQRRHYAETTTRHYIRTVEDFARRFNRPPDRLGPRHIREYQAELFWVGRWREDVIENGRVRRPYRSEVLGSKSDFPTKGLARRELEKRLTVVITILVTVLGQPQRLKSSCPAGSQSFSANINRLRKSRFGVISESI